MAICSATRQALLTGRNHHNAGMAGITEPQRAGMTAALVILVMSVGAWFWGYAKYVKDRPAAV